MSMQNEIKIDETNSDANLSLFKKLLGWFFNLFGFSMGGNGQPFDNDFVKNNRESVKSAARIMANHPLAESLLNMGLKIPGAVAMLKDYLKTNPALAEVMSEVIAENVGLQQKLAKNGRFMENFSDLMPESMRSQRPPVADASTSIEPEMKAFKEFAKTDPSLRNVLNSGAASLRPASGTQTPADPSMAASPRGVAGGAEGPLGSAEATNENAPPPGAPAR